VHGEAVDAAFFRRRIRGLVAEAVLADVHGLLHARSDEKPDRGVQRWVGWISGVEKMPKFPMGLRKRKLSNI